jgi:hypothetical protein
MTPIASDDAGHVGWWLSRWLTPIASSGTITSAGSDHVKCHRHHIGWCKSNRRVSGRIGA